jgi:hypothetical protein
MTLPLSGIHWYWKATIAGLCGTVAHTALMYFKSRSGILPTFQPYQSLQLALAKMTGSNMHPVVPWLLSWINGSAVLGFLFGRSYQFIPGHSGLAKGVVFGMLGWALMGCVFFPLLGLGIFATNLGLGGAPALFQLVMFMTYSIVLGTVYGALNSPNPDAA